MNIIYTLSTILIIGLHMLIYKKEEKQNLFKFIVINIALLLCYNIVICVILSFIKIKCTLAILSIVNFIVSITLGAKIFKDKKVQKYYLNKMDILASIIIIAIVIAISIIQYDIPFNLKHSTTDAATHYLVANEFYHYSSLLMEENSDIMGWWDEDFLMPGAYINTGIIFKIFSNLIDETYFPELYIMFDILMWCLSGLLMYVLLTINEKQKRKNILPLLFSIIYMLGYPLNSLLYGFSYLQIGLNTIICILITMKLNVNINYKNILMFIFDFALMFSYYYFAPIVFLSIFIQILIEIKNKHEKIFSVQNILNILIQLVIPGLFGVMYFIVFQQIKYGGNLSTKYPHIINLPGPIYENLITTVLIFVLLDIYYIIYSIKNKKQDISNKMLAISAIFVIILFIGMKLEKVSQYYYYKLYYMVWIFVTVVAFNAINILKEKNKILTYGGTALYCMGIIIAIIFNKNLLFFDIYQENFEEIFNKYSIISYKELEVFEYYNNNIDTPDNMDNNTYLKTERVGRQRWYNALTQNTYIYINATWAEEFVDIQQFFDSDKKYCIIFKADNKEIYENIDNIKNIKILFKNETGVIIEKY